MLRLAITLGDAAGVGPEILLRSVGSLPPTLQIIVYADADLLEHARKDLLLRGVPVSEDPLLPWDDNAAPSTAGIYLKHCEVSGLPSPSQAYPWGQAVPAFGALQHLALSTAIEDALARRIDGIVTLPWHKARLQDAGLPPTGHTEVLQEQTHAPEAIMVLAGDTLRVALATIHIPLSAVPNAISTDGIVQVTRVFHQGLQQDWGIAAPRIAVCGLNPHAGESGVIGHEDQQIIAPAIAALQREGIQAEGPFPADTIFPLVAHGKRPYDGIVAMYHDQGLGPLKTWHFSEAANITVGMPIVRTSVDHGTAYDIAGQGIASVDSFLYAFALAMEMAERRRALRGS